ncbi:hypothetical protein VB715_19270 [Crocosphaera sp. UHCC 0190]|uniref:hypothetical protein n=1 Tax=Crocosphaera sp. UHCC 0190 TaxID=3110246 RepID=UPI002B207308|nr:hypothetical protein [Crocosphaera sp. UHCC 0190]MEA5511918.1 hypothetical protein [Crocosphaera sp. UHCC 0190]
MRNRRQRKLNSPSQNLDSFLDILTNTVGVLMFISLFITVVAVESSSIVSTPLVSNTKKKPRFFEVRNNKISYINDEEIDRQIAILMKNLPECSLPEVPSNLDTYTYQYYLDRIQEYQSCRVQTIQSFRGFQGQTEHYKVTFYDLDALLYEPLTPETGESYKTISQTDSEFNKTLEKFDPNTDYLAFVVRPDSFAAFRSARKQAWKAGYNVGWEPLKQDTPIVFGSNGRTVGVQ